MSSLPPAIFFINGEITYPATNPVFIGNDPKSSELTTLKTQLYIDDTMTKTEFDARMIADPNYSTVVHLQGLRILVILPTFADYINRGFADVVMFLHQGLADIEYNRFGPPFQSFPIQRLTMYELLRASGSPGVVILPAQALGSCADCTSPYYCDSCHTFSGMKICQTCSGGCNCLCSIYAPNCDNEAHNINFIARK